MKDIKQQFKEFRETTPKHIQWLLLGAAFVVVIILITLLFGRSSKDNKNNKIEDNAPKVSFVVEPNQIDLTAAPVGESANQNVTITVNTSVVIDTISIDVPDITTTNNCDNLTDSCLINVIYKPTEATTLSNSVLRITWYVLSQSGVLQTTEIPVEYSAIKIEEPQPEIVAPVEEEVVVEEPEEEVEEEPIRDQMVDEIYMITSPDVFDEPDIDIPDEPVFEEPESGLILPSERCSDFAIPGYNQSGVQIGWIKPEHGANYFHPFADKTCSNPTGKYDFATGIITSLKDGKQIGTDANHIGYRNTPMRDLKMPNLSAPLTSATHPQNGQFDDTAVWAVGSGMKIASLDDGWNDNLNKEAFKGSAEPAEAVISSQPYDRTFILRQFKPIPATIVSEVRADPSVYGCNKAGGNCDPGKNHSIPVRATVDRNVFSDNGRTIIIPTGTLLMGYLDGDLPGPYQAVGRMNIKWYQFIRPDGVEFNFKDDNQDPYSADAQGRVGVPGHGSTDYIEQMVMPILTSLVPAAVNMIAPIADTVINQIDLDSNTIVQSGTMRSSEMAKQEVINTWNKVAQKLLVDVMANTTPPFSIAAGTRINVFSPVDLIVTCGGDSNKNCSIAQYNNQKRRKWSDVKNKVVVDTNDSSWVGQVRSFNLIQYCSTDSKTGKISVDPTSGWAQSGYDYRTVYAYCESQNYQAKNNAKQAVYNQNVQANYAEKYGSNTFNQTTGTLIQSGTEEQVKAYNQDVLNLEYADDNSIINPFAKPAGAVDETALTEENIVTCEDGTPPDINGCCTGETYTDNGPMDPNNPDGPHEFVCCPPGDGDCFPPILVE